MSETSSWVGPLRQKLREEVEKQERMEKHLRAFVSGYTELVDQIGKALEGTPASVSLSTTTINFPGLSGETKSQVFPYLNVRFRTRAFSLNPSVSFEGDQATCVVNFSAHKPLPGLPNNMIHFVQKGDDFGWVVKSHSPGPAIKVGPMPWSPAKLGELLETALLS